jgi:hypothetical protein
MLEQPVPAAREAHERMKAINARIAAAAARVGQPHRPATRIVAPGELGEQAFAEAKMARVAAEKERFQASKRQYDDALLFIRERHAAEGTTPVKELLMIAAEVSGVSIRDLQSERRSNEIVRPRQTFCWLARQFSLASFPQIGRLLGGRDHTTALYAFLRVESAARHLGAAPDNTPRGWATHLLARPWPSIGRTALREERRAG